MALFSRVAYCSLRACLFLSEGPVQCQSRVRWRRPWHCGETKAAPPDGEQGVRGQGRRRSSGGERSKSRRGRGRFSQGAGRALSERLSQEPSTLGPSPPPLEPSPPPSPRTLPLSSPIFPPAATRTPVPPRWFPSLSFFLYSHQCGFYLRRIVGPGCCPLVPLLAPRAAHRLRHLSAVNP